MAMIVYLAFFTGKGMETITPSKNKWKSRRKRLQQLTFEVLLLIKLANDGIYFKMLTHGEHTISFEPVAKKKKRDSHHTYKIGQ